MAETRDDHTVHTAPVKFQSEPPAMHLNDQSMMNQPRVPPQSIPALSTGPMVRQIQSVVTHSFSVEEERDDDMRQRAYPYFPNGSFDHQYHRTDAISARPQLPPPYMMPYSHALYHQGQGGYGNGMPRYSQYPPQLKRNFFHHAGPAGREPSLPSEFMPPSTPPKRTKISHRNVNETNFRLMPDGSLRSQSDGQIVPQREDATKPDFSRASSWTEANLNSFRNSTGEDHKSEDRDQPEDMVPQIPDRLKLMTDAAEQLGTSGSSGKAFTGIRLPLLSQPEDTYSLNETLCIVRENIEVFTATPADVSAPAPGRKHAICVGQVGLRCIHCRHTDRTQDRVKRAVCYPSSLKRIYRTVIDMKLDHFPLCPYVPHELKQRLEELKSFNTRSSSTTMAYFIKGAEKLGMCDAPSGSGVMLEKGVELVPSGVILHGGMAMKPPQATKLPLTCMPVNSEAGSEAPKSQEAVPEDPKNFFWGKVTLSDPEDPDMLSPLRCFLRKHIVAFSSSVKEIERLPGTSPNVEPGTVGIGCRYCMECPSSSRSARAICFPFSVGRIYQSVADIQRFHFPNCKNIPQHVRYEFDQLANATKKQGSRKFAVRNYWVSSAYKLGLGDTSKGIRFVRDPTKPSGGFSLDILAQAAFTLSDESKKLVVAEDHESVPEALLTVMEQLVPFQDEVGAERTQDSLTHAVCQHCANQASPQKFSWASQKELAGAYLGVKAHLLVCSGVPSDLKERIASVKAEQEDVFSSIAQAFFHRFWERLQDDVISNVSSNDEMDQREGVHEV